MLVGNVYKSKKNVTLYYQCNQFDGYFDFAKDQIVTVLDFIENEYGNIFWFKVLHESKIYYYRAINSVMYDVNVVIARTWDQIC